MKATVIDRLVDTGLCSGCGLCAGILPAGKVAMAMLAPGWLRPRVMQELSADDQQLIRAVCPGRSIVYDAPAAGAVRDTFWGPILDSYTGHATDADLRRHGASGGVVSGLLCHLLESGAVDLVVQVTADPADPTRTAVTLSRSREAVLRADGSRHAPSAPLASIGAVLEGAERAAFIGKPCDVAGLRALARIDPRVDQRIPVMLSFMCDGIPSETDPAREVFASRETVLDRHTQWRCAICPDGTGDFADVACGDACFEDNDGRSLVLARTAKGRALLRAAQAAGTVVMEPQALAEIARMQPFQKTRRQLVLSRVLAMAVLMRPTPAYSGAGLVRAALTARPSTQIRSFAAALRHLLRRRPLRRARGPAPEATDA